MESIKELREICQSTRPSIFGDFLSKIYYKVSIYFTWVCLVLKMSANQVTILSGAIAILGGFLISHPSVYITLLGGLCFHLFAILDMSDGEVARYRGQGGVEGHFLDWFMHFITPTALVMGLFLGSLDKLDNKFLLCLGLVAIIIPLLSKSIQNAGWTVIIWTLLRNKINKDFSLLEINEKEVEKKPESKPFKLVRLILNTPFEERWSSLLIILLPLMDLIITALNFNSIDYKFWWLMYLGSIGPIYIFIRINILIKTSSLKRGYNKIIDKNHTVILPQDDFL